VYHGTAAVGLEVIPWHHLFVATHPFPAVSFRLQGNRRRSRSRAYRQRRFCMVTY
jgi:hypothetical protein